MIGDRLRGGSALESEPAAQPNVVIRLAGWTGIACPNVQVFVDGRPVGVLSDGHGVADAGPGPPSGGHQGRPPAVWHPVPVAWPGTGLARMRVPPMVLCPGCCGHRGELGGGAPD